ncbi:NUDIX hydrolase [Mesorhizobium sp. DCY119]|jgi:8-oxo-dGTP pyrophosphatase MutT (NUDIX family)|uniref:NUDIX hydrolase n=1 Tax=Mesorhizobium sp. DCY119 TaxID=2108445 RepID=UPI000E6CECEF|nr:NUDIX hydrolase [Mesorhizobium sp. DCY119]RJG43702.1 NUDIX domain-containing protein [Mesorhizobium sp. DCY119]
MPSRQMLMLDGEWGRFNFRVAGIAISDNHVLLQRVHSYGGYWVLPGGRLELGEDTKTGLAREMAEELGAGVEIGRLVFIVENFFEEGILCHEMAFYYEMHLPSDVPDARQTIVKRVDHDGTELEFAWWPVDEATLTGLSLYPAFLRKKLTQIPSSPEHFVWQG